MNRAQSFKRGFTIVELVIIIVVIAILAAITFASYNGIQTRAVESTMQNDISMANDALKLNFVKNGSYPASLDTLNSGNGIDPSGDNSYTYILKPYGYCIASTNPNTTTQYRYKSSGGIIEQGSCDAVVTTFYTGVTQPRSLTMDASGTLYLSEYGAHRIRTFTVPGAVISTLAGSGSTGSSNGTGTGASFYYPDGIDLDSAGNAYVADSSNYTIRKITPAGVTSTFTGTVGVSGTAEGGPGVSRFVFPRGVAVASDGTVYVAESSKIRQITPAGVTSILAGHTSTTGFANGAAGTARFNYPNGIALGSDGYLYVADSGNHRIRKVSTVDGSVSTLAGSTSGYTDATGTSAQFNYPMGIAVSSQGVVYVSDTNNQRLRAITSAGVVTTLAGSSSGSTDGDGAAAQFNSPQGLTIDASGNVLYLADYNNSRIRKITL